MPLGIAAVYILSALALPGAVAGIGDIAIYRRLLSLIVLGGFPCLLAVVFLRIRVGGSWRAGWPAAIRLARARGWFTERLISFLIVLAVLPLFFWAFAAWKSQVEPFTWDATLAHLDLVLHGRPPHEWLPDRPPVLRMMDLWYWTWNYLFLGVVLWQAWCGTYFERTRFWLAFVLVWIVLGTVVAHLLASAGPAFYFEATGDPGPYRHLRAQLAQTDAAYDLHLLDIRGYLWQAVHQGKVVFGGGISAFPSLHIALPTLAGCAAWHVSRWLSLAFVIYALVTLVCAVALGWHYAVDGYASVLLVPLLWWVAGVWSRR